MKPPAFFTKLLSDYFRWTAVGLVVVILAGGYWFILRTQLSTIQTTALTERANIQDQLKTEQQYFADLQSSIQRFHQVLPESSLSVIDDFLPSKTDFPGLLLTIRNVAQAANIKLSGLSVSQTGQTSTQATAGVTAAGSAANAASATIGSVKTQDVTVTLSGGTTYTDFKRLLGTIERSRRLLDVLTLSFGVGGASGTTGSTGAAQSYNLILRTYYLPST